MSDDQPHPTAGQRRVLQLVCRVAYVLIGERAAPGAAPVYTLCERGPVGAGRVVHPVAPAMVAQLQAAGWIERASGDAGRWVYRVTPSGIWAANAPIGGVGGERA